MKIFFTKALMGTLLLVGFFTAANAQTPTVLWPTSDIATINASQFADTSQIFWSRTGNLTPPTGFTGWVTRGISSTDPAKKDSARFVWRRDASAVGGAYFGTRRSIGSPSKANGAAVMNSDFLDNNGDPANSGGGQSPSPHSCELISPTMDATGKTDVIVQFHQYFRRFSNTTTSIQYSTDDGTTWSSKFTFNPESEISVNGETLNPIVATNTDSTLKRVVLKGSVGTNKFKIKFVFDANYYFWVIDDVKLIDLKFFDMKMSGFYAIPPSLYTQKEQLEPMRFLADVSNIGVNDMKNTKLIVKIWRASDNALIHADSTADYPVIFKSDTTYENRVLPKTFDPRTLNPGIYFGSYRVKGDSSGVDLTPGNDTIRFNFVVSDFSSALSVVVTGVGQHNYAKENGSVSITRVSDGFWTATEPKSWRIGNYYRFNNATNKTVTTLIARLNASAAAGRTIGATMYEWVDANKDDIVQATERTLVAVADTTVPAAQANAGAWFLFNLKDLQTNGAFKPKSNTDYLAMIEFDAPAPATPALYLTAGFSRGLYDYQAMRFVTDSFLLKPRYTMIMGISNDRDWSTAGFSDGTLTPCIRLNVVPTIVNTKDVLSSDNKVDIFPNPASSNFATLQFDMVKPYDCALRVYSMEGRFLAEQVIEQLHKQTVKLDISDYPSGSYFIQVLTSDGIMTQKFIVAK